jgi:predicted DNA-binding transcriptional regulator AlpA
LTDVNWASGVTGRLAGVGEIAKLLGVSRTRADQLSRQQGFPKPYDVLAADTPRPQRVWRTVDIEAWIKENRTP